MRAIYKPAGRAAEYAPLAVNLYTGCGHACTYCWAPQVLRLETAEFFRNPQPRPDLLPSLAKLLLFAVLALGTAVWLNQRTLAAHS